MERHHFFSIILIVCAVNGIFSPYLLLVMAIAPAWYPLWLPFEQTLLFFLSSLIVSTGTLLLSGVPAALLEGAIPALNRTPMAMLIWLVAALGLSVPSVQRLLGG